VDCNGPLVQTTVKNNPREHQAPCMAVAGVTHMPIDLNQTAPLLNELLANLPQIISLQDHLDGSSGRRPL
jgi:hypothetical protein